MEQPVSILVWDQNDAHTARKVAEAVEEYQSVVIPCSSPEALLFTVEHRSVDVVVLSLQKPFEQAFHLLSEVKTRAAQVEVVFVSRFDEETLWVWVEAIQRGAYEFLPKPLDLAELKRILVQASEKHRPLKLRKRAPAESVKGLAAKAHKRRPASDH
jgi:DNA-binding NtrC family response regulator